MTNASRPAALSTAALIALAALLPVVASGPLDEQVEGQAAAEAVQTIRQALLPLDRSPLDEAFWRLADLSGTSILNETINSAAPPWLSSAPLALQPTLALLWGGIEAAHDRLEAALANVNETQRTFLLENGHEIIEASNRVALGIGSGEDEQLIEDYQATAALLDMGQLGRAQEALVTTMLDGSALVPPGPFLPKSNPQCASGSVIFEAAACAVVVGGPGPTIYNTNIVLLLDLGGNDLYLNNAGGASLLDALQNPGGVAMLVDLDDGNDYYSSSGISLRAVQGGGCLGVGLLADFGGSDTYVSAASPVNCVSLQDDFPPTVAHGSGLVGSGVLVDFCNGGVCGDDVYDSFVHAQGLGQSGFGLLLDEGGNDVYKINLGGESEAAQGTGCVGGFGALVDRGEGSDNYNATTNDQQGFGCVGGLGVLWDGGGDDSYMLRSNSGDLGGLQSGWGQAFGELGGLGVLLDLRGADSYVSENTVGATNEAKYVQGAGREGKGYLLDLDGPDSYSARLGCQGWGGAGTGVLYDNNSEGDSYSCEEPAVDCVSGQSTTRQDATQWCSGALGTGIDNH